MKLGADTSLADLAGGLGPFPVCTDSTPDEHVALAVDPGLGHSRVELAFSAGSAVSARNQVLLRGWTSETDRAYDLIVMNADGTSATVLAKNLDLLAEGYADGTAFSPDGLHVAWAGADGVYTADLSQVGVVEKPDLAVRKLTDTVGAVAFDSGGTLLLLAESSGALQVLRHSDGVTLDSGACHGGYRLGYPAWSDDEQWFMYAQTAKDTDLDTVYVRNGVTGASVWSSAGETDSDGQPTWASLGSWGAELRVLTTGSCSRGADPPR